jgi:16S rRNA (cytosine967-C5)-methyltransferase
MKEIRQMALDIPRETALKTIYDINEKGAYSNIALNRHMESTELKAVDRAFITEITYGITKYRLTLDWIIEQFSSVKLKKISPWVLNILRLGVYQIIYMDKVPDSAACNESVNLSKKYSHQASSRFVNGVLRNISRNKTSIAFPDNEKDTVRYLSVKYSHPEWMVKNWLEKFGRKFTESLLESNNQVPDLTVRVNTLKTTREKLIEQLCKAGIEAAPGIYMSEAVILKGAAHIAGLEVFKNGLFQVQGESSMLVGRILDPKPGQLVMDVCSAPGGKSTHLAQLMKNEGIVLARDIHEHKIRLIEEAAKRLGTNVVHAEMYDAAVLDDNYIEKADRVLVDAPCTGLGIIRKKPDIKWARIESDKKEILRLQKKILDTSSRYVKPGGMLVYSTCTIEDDENSGMVKSFLEAHKEFMAEDISGLLPESLKKADTANGSIQLYPNTDKVDGFFIAKMRRL